MVPPSNAILLRGLGMGELRAMKNSVVLLLVLLPIVWGATCDIPAESNWIVWVAPDTVAGTINTCNTDPGMAAHGARLNFTHGLPGRCGQVR